MASVRMYVQKGCPHCEGAKVFLQSKGISVEAIEIGFDPIINGGIKLLTNGQNFQIPLTISYLTGEVIPGNDPVALQRIVDSFSTGASNPAA